MESSVAAVVDKVFSQQLRKKLECLRLSDLTRRLALVGGTRVAIPVIDTAPFNRYKRDTHYEIDGIQFNLENIPLPRSKSSRRISPHNMLCDSLKQLLARKNVNWTPELDHDVPHKWKRHGDLVLLPSGCFSRKEWQGLGDQVWIRVCEVLGVKRLAKESVVQADQYRSPQVKLLLGDNGWVQHVDNGIIYSYDVTRCMFSAGNITEKLRIASFDCSGETVVDMFAGIGYFTLPYLVHAKAYLVYACEWNPDAVEALKLNLELNKVSDKCQIIQGDNRKICPKGVADRVNLGLIPSSQDSWPAACSALKATGGILHIHGNVTDDKITYSSAGTKRSSSDATRTQCSGGDTCCTHSGEETRPQDCENHQNQLQDEKCKSGIPHNKLHKLAWLCWAKEVCSQIESILLRLHNKCWTGNILHVEHVKSYAPHVDHLVLDLECRPLGS